MTLNIPDGSTVIVGGGIIGLACAHYLSADGHRVVVLDQGAIAGGCSLGNCGHILPSHVLPLNSPNALKTGLFSIFNSRSAFRVKPQLNLSFMNWMFQFARYCATNKMLLAAAHLHTILEAAFAEYERLVEERVFDCGWRQSGLMYVFRSEKALDRFAKTDALLSDKFGLAAERLDSKALKQHDAALRTDLAGGYFYNKDALLQPDLLSTSWVQYLKKNGVIFVENCEVTGVEKGMATVRRLKTSLGNVDIEQLIIASGALSGGIAADLECSIPVIPGKGYSVTYQRPDVCPKTSLVLPEKNVALTPFKNSFRIGSMMEFVGFDNSLPAHRIAQLTESASEYLVSDFSGMQPQPWFGWRPMTWDSLPLIGRLPNHSNVCIATGHGMMGIMLAPATGRLIAEIVGEKNCHIAAKPYSPARFQTGSALHS